MTPIHPRVLPCGDEALLLELPSLPAVLALADELTREPVDGQVALVVAARTLLITLDPEADRELLRDTLSGMVITEAMPPALRDVTIDVVYDGEDLAAVAELTGLTRNEVIAAHTGTSWTVAFAGFAPGFGYLVGGDHRLQVPRRDTPRTAVPAGAVALAGEFAGVYPRESPGGWQLIGRTDAVLWDTDRDPPALFEPGVRVTFTEATA